MKSDKEEVIIAAMKILDIVASDGDSRFKEEVEFVWVASPADGAKLAAQFTKGDTEVTASEIEFQWTMADYIESSFNKITLLLEEEDEDLRNALTILKETVGMVWSFEDIIVCTPVALVNNNYNRNVS